jgi:hypothetical protein
MGRRADALTVACVWVQGEYPYTADYVHRLYAMVKRHLARPFSFVCLTDRPWEIADTIRTIPVQRFPDSFACWTKMRLFDPTLGFSGRVLALDLDSLIVGALDPVLDYPQRFVMATDCLTTVGTGVPAMGTVDRYGRALVQKFQGSVMVWNAGAHADLYTDWTPQVAHRLSTDQDWIGERYPDAGVLPLSWTPRISEIKNGRPSPDAKIVFCKKPKNDIAEQQWPWVSDVWRAA